MTWHAMERDGALLQGFDTGDGRPVLFQHGLGGDQAQVAEVFPDRPAFRRLTLECRGHGRSEPAAFSIAAFAGDVLAFAAARGVTRFAIGGMSMGAAIALRVAVKQPDRVTALILARPAWTHEAAPANMQVFAELASFLETGDRTGFAATETAQMLSVNAPDNLASLMGFFDRPDPATTARLLRTIAADGPGVTDAELRALATPTLVLANRIDHVHPVATAAALAEMIPGARMVELTPKATDRQRHAAEFRIAVADFLNTIGHAP